MPEPTASRPLPTQSPTLSRANKRSRAARKPHLLWRIIRNLSLFGMAVFSMFGIWFFFTPSGNHIRNIMADTIIATQHRDWAKYLIGKRELERRVAAYWSRFDEYAAKPITETAVIPTTTPPAAHAGSVGAGLQATPTPTPKPLTTIEPVEGKGFKGYILYISDPKKLRIAVPAAYGKGEKVSSMVKRTGAIAGVNAGGFVDPEWKGNGFQPTGIVMSGGKLFYNDAGMDTKNHVVGIDKEGHMIAGKYSPNELLKMGMSEAVTFAPRFIVNGEGQIKSEADGWGIAPRTCMAQKADGTIMFAIIDGRQTHSIGATLYDVQKLFLERGAIIAANLDGGSSTVLVKGNEIVNKPASEYGERYLPTAWLVFDDPQAAPIRNVWEGVDIRQIDPSKW